MNKRTRVVTIEVPHGDGVSINLYEVLYRTSSVGYNPEFGTYSNTLWNSYQVFKDEELANMVADLIETRKINPR